MAETTDKRDDMADEPQVERQPARRYELNSPPAASRPPAPNPPRSGQPTDSRPRPIPGYQPPAANPRQPAPLAPPQPRRPHRQPAAEETPYLTRYRTEEPEQREGRVGKVAGWLAVLVAVFFVAGLASVLIYQQVNGEKIYPGVHVLDLDLSGLSSEQAKAKLTDRLAAFSSKPVMLVFADRQWQPQLAEVGVSIDADATLQAAYDVGRKGGLTDTLGKQWQAWREGVVVPLRVNLDETQIGKYLRGVAVQIAQPLKEGDVQLDPNTGAVSVVVGQDGRDLDLYASVGALKAALNNLQTQTVLLPVTITHPIVSEAEAKRVAERLNTWLSAPLVASYAEKNYTLDRSTIARWIAIARVLDRQATGDHITVSLAASQIEAFSRNIAKDVNRAPQNARFSWNGSGVAVISESVDGRQLDPVETASLLFATLNQPAPALTATRSLALPVQILSPTVSSQDVGALGIKQLVGSGRSTFAGSTKERAQNIRVAAAFLNGTVVPPGATFSFLNSIGDISLERGYAEGYVIAAERTKKDVGGGVCQVSTTAFRAAFWSGLPIVERNQHSYRVSWYEQDGSPVGFDAAVFDPGVDMKFVNDSGAYLLVEADAQGSDLVVNIYGTKAAGLDVQMVSHRAGAPVPPPPDRYEVDNTLAPGTKKQVDYAHAGISATIVRQITKNGETKTDSFGSNYKPWPNIFLVAAN